MRKSKQRFPRSLTVMFGLVALLAGQHLFAASDGKEQLTARQVIELADARDDGDTAIADYTLVLIDRRDRQRVRDFTFYRQDEGEDTRTLAHFDSPADIRGTAYLNLDWDDPERDDDSWLYLPTLQRVKRIASSDKSDAFLGSDFSYADINGFEIAWFDYSFVAQSELVDGADTWVIEATPKPEFKERAEDETGYSHMRLWIRKDNYIQARGQAWELRGNRIKFFTSSDIEQIDGIWTVRRMQATTTRNGRRQHASVLQVNDVTYNAAIEQQLFTTENMQRGLD